MQKLLTHLQTKTKMPGLCMIRDRDAARVGIRGRSPFQQYKKDASLIIAEEESELISHEIIELSMNRSECGNRVMVVVDSNNEAKGALEWALSHTVQNRGIIILLHVDVVRKDGKSSEEIDHLLEATKDMCQLRRPEVHVDVVIREGKDKGAIIVEAADELRVSLLVLGQWNQSFLWQWHLRIWMRRGARSRVVDYCIQNANCKTIAVRKSKKYGGYLITTKRHNNFWLLA